MRRLVQLALFCAGSIGPGAGMAGEPIVLGMSAAFSGASRGLGIELHRGARAYFDALNAAGGIVGRPVVIRALDDGYDPVPAIENSLRLLADEDVVALFGYVGTPTVTRVLPLLKLRSRPEVLLDTPELKLWSTRGLLMFFPFTGAQPLRAPPYGEFVFNLRASYRDETAALVEGFATAGRQRLGIFYQADAYGRSGWDGVRRAAARSPSEVVAEATYRRGARFDADFGDQVEILRGAGAEAVIAIGAYAACAGFIRDARDAGWAAPIANLSFVGSDNLLELLRTASQQRGLDYTAGLVNSEVVPSYEDTALPAVREYRERMDRIDPRPEPGLADPDYRPLRYSAASLEGYLNAKLMTGILRRADDPLSPDDLRRAAESLESIDLGIGTPVGFGPHDHQGLERVYFTTVREGRFVPFVDWSTWQP